MKICFVPIDNRPVCYSLAKDIVSIDSDIELFLPPREYLGDLKKVADIDKILEWLKTCPKSDIIILALDTIAYGGLIPSRRSKETFLEIKKRLELLKEIIIEKEAKTYAFSSIMRISNNNCNEEEKEYWKDYGKKIFEYSFSGGENKSDIPQDIIDDYLETRKRNFEINKIYLNWQKENLFKLLIFSKDDCAEFGFNVDEANILKELGGYIKTGADEIPLSLLSASIEKEIKVFVEYTEPNYINLISNYEDISIESSIIGQLELGGFKKVENKLEADIILLVNNFKEKQGELVMNIDTQHFCGDIDLPNAFYAVADVRFANGADNSFVKKIIHQIDLDNFYGYAAWNTSANTLGSLLAAVKIKFNAKKYNDIAFKKLQTIRFLDDWAYQANVRKQITLPVDIKSKMIQYEEIVLKCLNYKKNVDIKYVFPWNRIFEVEVNIE